MEYKYAGNKNFEDFASGRVIYHMGGTPTFPVRLALEIYERCRQYSVKKTDITLYDCCCGGAYMLTVLGFLKNNSISSIYGSDIDMKSLKLAEDNLSLLSEPGLRRRKEEIEELYASYGKSSHYDALQSIEIIGNLVKKDIKTHVFYQNIFEVKELPFIPDIIITDVPYGQMVGWNQEYYSDSPKKVTGYINQMMNSISRICGSDTIICIFSDKKQKIKTDIFQRLEKQLIGKRKFEIFCNSACHHYKIVT